MEIIIIFLIAAIAPSLSQYGMQTGIRPDISFDDDNSRFDVSNILRQQKRYNKARLDPQSEEYRRRERQRPVDNVPWTRLIDSSDGRKIIKKRFKKTLAKHVNDLANTIIMKIKNMRRYNDDFAYHDNMNSEGGDENDFNNNLKKFARVQDSKEDDLGRAERRQYRLQNIVNKLHGANHTRRLAIDPEKEILLHYAFPVDMKVEGFLQAPLD